MSILDSHEAVDADFISINSVKRIYHKPVSMSTHIRF